MKPVSMVDKFLKKGDPSKRVEELVVLAKLLEAERDALQGYLNNLNKYFKRVFGESPNHSCPRRVGPHRRARGA